MTRRIWFILPILAACAQQPSIGERIAAKCESLGFPRGTPEFGQCYLSIQRDLMAITGRPIQMPYTEMPPPMQAPRPTSTTCYVLTPTTMSCSSY